MSSKPRSRWQRPLLLVGLMGGLGGVLYWQKSHEFQAARQKNVAEQERVDVLRSGVQRFNLDMETLAKERLAEAEAEAVAAKIAALKKERAEASRWPYLVVPTPAHAQTRETIQAEYLQYRLRELEAYRQHTNDSGAAKAAGERFLEAYLPVAADRTNAWRNFTPARELGQAALKAGSRDPMLRTYLALCDQMATGDIAAAAAEWNATLKELPKTKYPQTVQVYAWMFLRDLEVESRDRQKRWEQALPAMIAWLEEDAESPRWIRSVCERLWALYERADTTERYQLMTGCLLSKKMDHYIPHTLVGSRFIDLAWNRRGGGWAANVKPEQWEGFRKYLKAAAAHLQYAWSLHPELPQAPESLVKIAMAGEIEDRPYFWFLRTVEARFDDEPAYSNLAFALTTRWSGSRRDLYAFAHNCVETLRFDTLVPYQAVDILQLVQRMELDEGETLASDPQALKLLRRFLELRKSFVTASNRQPMYEDSGAYRSGLLLLLETCGLDEEATNLLQESKGNLNWTTLRAKNRPGRFLAARRLAIQGSLRERIAAFDDRLRQAWQGPVDPQVFDEMEAERQDLQSQIEPVEGFPADFADYFAHADMMIRHQRAYNAGDWLDLELSPTLAGWEPYADSWSFDVPGGVVLSGRYGKEDQIALRPLTPFPYPLEVEADVELQEPGPYLARAGIGWSREGMTTLYDRDIGIPLFYTTVNTQGHLPKEQRIRRDSAQISYWEGYQSGFSPLKDQYSHRLRLKLWKEYAEFRADDAWYAVPLIQGGLRDDGWICFGEASPHPSGEQDHLGSVRLANVRLRRLSFAVPPEVTAPLEERAHYWETRYHENQEDIVAVVHLLGVRADQYRHSEALSLIEQAEQLAPTAFGIQRWKGIVLTRLGRYAEAQAAFNKMREEWRDDVDAIAVYAELLASAPDDSVRNGKAAEQTIRFCLTYQRRENGPQRAVLQAHAAAQAELGQFDAAVETQLKAMDADADVADAFTPLRLESYRAHQPWRRPATLPTAFEMLQR